MTAAFAGDSNTTGASPGTSPAAAAGRAASDDGQRALASLLERLDMACGRAWRAVAAELGIYAGAAMSGLSLRSLTGLPTVAAIGLEAAVVVTGLLPTRRRGGPSPLPVPAWAVGAEAVAAGLPTGLAHEQRGLAAFAGRTRRRGAFMTVFACRPQHRQAGLCQSALIYQQHGYLLAVVGEHVQPTAAATLGHELAHLSGWRHQLARTAGRARLAGWLLAGWAAGWPWLLAAGATIQAVTMLARWTAEVGCDRQAAREHGAAAVITSLTCGWCPHPRKRPWERRLISSLRYLTGLTRHPPVPVRCLVLRTLPPPTPQPCGQVIPGTGS